jgi:hypothetical protein
MEVLEVVKDREDALAAVRDLLRELDLHHVQIVCQLQLQ